MSADVIDLVTERTVAAAWDEYDALVLEQSVAPALLRDVDHQVKIARAWKRWRDLFNRWDDTQTAEARLG